MLDWSVRQSPTTLGTELRRLRVRGPARRTRLHQTTVQSPPDPRCEFAISSGGCRSLECTAQKVGEPGEVTAQGPATNGHPTEIEVRLDVGSGVKCVHLVLEHGARDIAVDRSFPCRAATRGAAPVNDKDRKALVRPPLRFEPD